ncbi:hypothetical protein J3Q64DRAFT_1722277 [Phycomyces blakesleeanus]|uniref:Uncharacterized protein n=2 Tax=Phycomyces blakesleeanus TaxID=4837 RepID=A0A162UJD5_PHYB8|nr:hypothetical protein PHYBLDRAFT_142157 [Phycomyces blakesleeanus NRRL 1555(-)]OAD76642.1 hypothetical protein PHYBLDRAFT_142157 [Phycomyces blakesleeanus NRRL 1555(-)]|eukprot:XP_018294682.1 hypothetical protein PHYBLDRAFT_142157 [Phycomyces blakesleeanus NRRL 1555(-)]
MVNKADYPPNVPPPAYNNGPTTSGPGGVGGPNTNLPGQTYYQPPPLNEQPLPGQPPVPPPAGERKNPVMTFYAPPQNRSLGLRRRLCSVVLCCIIIGLVVGLASGLTRRSYNSGRGRCQCRVNSDCYQRFGPGVYCQSNCMCGR